MVSWVVYYELKRAVARRKVIVMVAITLLFEVGVYVILSQLRTPSVEQILAQIQGHIWLVGTMLPLSLLLHFISISISSGSMSEEYEQGTVDFFLTKPLNRVQFLTGKFVGGYILVLLIYLLMVALALVMSFIFFGSQRDLGYLPELVGTVAFSAIPFYTIGFMLGEVLRRTTISFLSASSILIGSILIGGILVFVSKLLSSELLVQAAVALPSWGAVELPFIYASSIPNSSLIVQAVEVFPAVNGSQVAAVTYSLAYFVAATAIAYLSFTKRDVPKRIS
ncbi:ABC transporter permease [Sulfodiicoccus acidiphilus]|uniref:ABC transporter permease n=1 Tax=Sulfodiicoccus acidiphilus TaxID=1670455 RepID=A0A348B2D0_9CREN|nr:ABC transporter permease [Sulfodiicoccus acidiphilus]BBD72332.1 ABC transporter permease [Sulfodiicoccus acidiphilus]GGT90213.1 ABC transporter permease [Sulfodiicoccus acidiphilus]